MTDDRLDQRIREAARAYNSPPETPREPMWAMIAEARAGEARAGEARRSPAADAKPRVLPLRSRRWLPLATAFVQEDDPERARHSAFLRRACAIR